MKTKYLKIRSSLIAMAAVALVTAMTGSTVQAVLVLANGATNFYDNFDSAPDVVGNPPVNGPVGGWSNVESSPGFTRVTNGPPTGIQGPNYLLLSRPPGGNAQSSAGFNTGVSSGTLVLKTMVLNQQFGSSAPLGYASQIEFRNNSTTRFDLYGVTNKTTGTLDLDYSNGTTELPTGLNILQGKWQEWDVTLNFTTHTFIVSVDGISSVPLSDTRWTSSNNDINNVIFKTPDNGSLFGLDAVPEPSALALLAFGGLFLKVYRRRS